MSRLVPFSLHHPIKALFWGSEEEDTFPVRYKMNSRAALKRVFDSAGLSEILFSKLDDLSIWSRYRLMNYAELMTWSVMRVPVCPIQRTACWACTADETTSVTARFDAASATMTPIRIGFVLHVMQVAGAEVLVAETIRQLRPHLEPVVLCLDRVGQLGAVMQQEGVPVIDLQRRPGLDPGVVRRLADEIRRRRLEVVHAHQYTPFFYAALARTFVPQRIHLLFTEHGRHYPDHVSAKRRWTNRLVLRHLADEITGVCRFSAESLAAKDGFPAARVQVIENGIQFDRYASPPDRAALRVSLNLDAGPPVCRVHRPLPSGEGSPDAAECVCARGGRPSRRGSAAGRGWSLACGSRIARAGVGAHAPRAVPWRPGRRAGVARSRRRVRLDLGQRGCFPDAARSDGVGPSGGGQRNVGGNPEIVREGTEGSWCRVATPPPPERGCCNC
jgi:hypothetical protein